MQLLQMHRKGSPFAVCEVWDAASAKAIEDAGAQVVGTSVGAIGTVHGHINGAMPMSWIVEVLTRIVDTVNVPVVVDLAGRAGSTEELISNAGSIAKVGCVGFSVDDNMQNDLGLHSIRTQTDRLEKLRRLATTTANPFLIDAGTHLFVEEPDASRHSRYVSEAVDRAAAYKEAGASSFSIPGLADPELIKAIVDRVGLPVGVSTLSTGLSGVSLSSLGVARINYGAGPRLRAMEQLASDFRSTRLAPVNHWATDMK